MNPTETLLSIMRAAPRSFIHLPSEAITAPAQSPRFPSAFAEAIATAISEGMAFGPLVGGVVKKLSRAKVSPRPKHRRELNAVVAKYGVEIQHERGSGYFYFTDISTEAQVGESVMVCYYADLTLSQWAELAAAASLSKPRNA